MELSIICVNWNSVDFLRGCLTSIYAENNGIEFEVIVVDNASPDGLAPTLKREFSQITLIESGCNLGFAGANNLGFKHSSGEYVLFLNPDTKLVGPAVSTMLNRLKSLPDGGIAGCKLLNSDLSVQTSCIQRFPTITGQMFTNESLRLRYPQWRIWGIAPLYENPKEPTEVEVVSGACLMIKRNVFEMVGGFSEEYFMYAEDMDLCYKVRKAGFKVFYVGDVIVIHHGGGSSSQREHSHWATIAQREAMLQFLQRTRGRAYACVFRTAMGVASCCRLVAMLPLYFFVKTFRRKRELSITLTKHAAILLWAFGFGRRTLGSSASDLK